MPSKVAHGIYILWAMAKTPSSLKWLINKRARILGHIKKIESNPEDLLKAQHRLKEAIKEVNYAKNDLAFKKMVTPLIIDDLKNGLEVIDRALQMHEIQIPPSLIPSLRPHEGMMLKYGVITKQIIKCLKYAGVGGLKTSQIVLYIKVEEDLELTHSEHLYFHRAVRKRLQALCVRNVVERLHCHSTTSEGSWRLKKQSK